MTTFQTKHTYMTCLECKNTVYIRMSTSAPSAAAGAASGAPSDPNEITDLIVDALCAPKSVEALTELKARGISLELAPLGTKNANDVLYAPFSREPKPKDYFNGLLFLLNDNPPTPENIAFFVTCYPPLDQSDFPLLFRAIYVSNLEVVKKLVELGADIHSVYHGKSLFNGMAPLDAVVSHAHGSGRGNLAIFDYLRSKGAPLTLSLEQIFELIDYGYFNHLYGSEPLETQVLYMILYGRKNSIFIQYFNENASARTMLKRKDMLDLFIEKMLTSHQNSLKMEAIRCRVVYNLLFPFDPAFTYEIDPKIAFSQKGYTCGQDVLFTILFECQDFKPILDYDWEKFKGINNAEKSASPLKAPILNYVKGPKWPSANKNLYNDTYKGSTLHQYAIALEAAKERYLRMPTVTKATFNSFKGPLRRQASVENNVWQNSYRMINTSCKPTGSGGLRFADMSIFLEKLLTLNAFKIKDLPPFEVNMYEATNPPPANVDNACAIILLSQPSNATNGHYIGFYENDGSWYCVDNEVGFIHKIQDTEWFNTIFVPRMLRSVHEKSMTNGSEKVFLLPNSKLADKLLEYQFFTPGERSYPNLITLGDRTSPVWIPYAVTVITRIVSAPVAAAGAATGSAVASADSKPRRGGRRTRRTRHTSVKTRRAARHKNQKHI